MNVQPISQQSFKALFIERNADYTEAQRSVINRISLILDKNIEEDIDITYRNYFEKKNIGFYAQPSIKYDSVDLSFINNKEPKAAANSKKGLKKIGTFSITKPFNEQDIKNLYLKRVDKDLFTDPKSILTAIIFSIAAIIAAITIAKSYNPNITKDILEKTPSEIKDSLTKHINSNDTLQIK